MAMDEGTDRGDDEAIPLDGRHVIMTPTGVTFLLSEEDQEQARRCLEESGKVTINFGEIRVSSLNEVRRITDIGAVPDGGAPAPGPGPID